MWLICPSLVFCVLIVAESMPPSVFSFFEQFKVVNVIVLAILVYMVNVVSGRDRPVGCRPDVAVQISASAIRPSVIPANPQCISLLAEHDVRQRLWFWSQINLSASEHLIDGLPRHPKRRANFRKAMALLIEIVHRVRFFVLGSSAHVGIVIERLTGDNHCI